MKKIYRPLLKGTNWALAGLLGLLGFHMASCEGGGAPEYGTPHATYVIKGKVSNTKGVAIPAIEVKGVNEYNKEHMNELPTDYPYKTVTNAQGEYELSISAFPSTDVTVYATDVDEAANGLYQPDSAQVIGKRLTLKGGKGWYEGKATTTVDFTLKEEKTDGE